MTEGTSPIPLKVALVSMPWPIVNRPSLQLATLKSYVEEKSAYTVDCFHPYLHLAKVIGIETYARIARSGWAGEALFAPLLFPLMKSQAKQLFRQSLLKKGSVIADFEELVKQVEQSVSEWLRTKKFDCYHLLGLSVCFFQLLPSLYLAAKIKEKYPKMLIVFGGSSCSGKVGTSLFERFQQIDFLTHGEGEESLLRLCRYLAGMEKSLPDEILSRQASLPTEVHVPKVLLNDLPYPNFTPYFNEIRDIFPNEVFIPVLPIEFSRGCWWNRCSFCNLNLQWSDYRFKSGHRMVAETTHLAKTHACLQFAFADNALPSQEADRFFTRIAATHMDFDFFAELRVISEQSRLELYSQGGLRTIQVGIEALSSTLLAKMAKGSTVIDNIAAMKLSSSCSIHLEGNLITEFPGTTAEEIAETLTNLDFVLPFAPLQAAVFFLGYGSPIYSNPKDFSIQAILPHSKNKKLFPKAILRGMTMISNSYRGDREQQRKLWRPVTKKLRAWQDFHQQRKNKSTHPLNYRDGSTFLIISQERISGKTLLHRLRGVSREIYLFCAIPRNMSEILAAFPTISNPILKEFLLEMSNKRLMFREGTRTLSLAIRRQHHG
ncbi:MAG: RiPP maturation radical SAM C-methyltransferase [Proteobacteria bacterium]|nr:RiPP maturation radical SAM C-methyltransferase [Pseudomonadota bacterium]